LLAQVLPRGGARVVIEQSKLGIFGRLLAGFFGGAVPDLSEDVGLEFEGDVAGDGPFPRDRNEDLAL